MIASGVTPGQRRRADLMMIWFAASVALAFVGCAGARMAQPESMPSSAAEGHQEMEQLEREIARGRVALGLSAREEIAMEGDSLSPAPKDMDASTMAQSPVAEGSLSPAAGEAQSYSATEPPHSPSQAPTVNSVDRQSKAVEDEEETCPGPCRFTQAICKAAGRICRIAGYLGESDAQQRCQRAQQDCAEARRTTSDSCPDC